MPGLVWKNAEVEIDGLNIVNFKDDPRLLLSKSDGRKRPTTWPRNQIDHTTKGIPGGRNRTKQYVRPGTGPNRKKDYQIAKMWANDGRNAGTHGIIDADASVAILQDLFSWMTYNAGNRKVNAISIGWEMYQEGDAGIWQATIDAQVAINRKVCELSGMQYQVHGPYRGDPISRLVQGGADCVGIFGHRDVTSNRGQGDPGDFILEALVADGAARFDFGKNEDKEFWKDWQYRHDLIPDGVPGPLTVSRLKEEGYRHGVYAFGKADELEEQTSTDERVCEFACPIAPVLRMISTSKKDDGGPA